MTEKQYGGATGRGMGKIASNTKTDTIPVIKKTENNSKESSGVDNASSIHKDKFIKAGKIASEAVKFARSIVKKDVPLLEIADKIEAKIAELGGKCAFPVNLSINEIAAHDTPSWNDSRVASGLLKVDLGVQIDGCTADTAITIDLENSEENKKLITATEKAVLMACKTINFGVKIREVGAAIEKELKSAGFTPINNLSGHSIEQYHLHAGITIPNYDNSQEKELEEGVYATEPFATTGLGRVRDGKPSGIYKLENEAMVRDSFAREVLAFIYDEYQTLPFCSRWICKKFGSRGLLALKRIEDAGIIHQYAQLVEVSGNKVAQVEHTNLIEKGKKTIITV